ncbi:hypothetical protein NDU88_009207 [Pleurodeles waltl]|uniref:Uncharacterized protein n=1 Tax=Pleurodeles waltl TaxID=8319 RepID=A0AAV7P003_PLEWA|nr:hypothetical protein NDU88_009207 [Pleurodeles waltl]
MAQERTASDARSPRDQATMMPLEGDDPLYPELPRSRSLFCEGEFLRLDQVLEEFKKQGSGWGPNGGSPRPAPIIQVYRRLETKPLQVVRLKHVTVRDRFLDILEDGRIRGWDRPFLLNGEPRPLRVSCWAVHLPPPDLDNLKRRRLRKFAWVVGPQVRASMRGLSPQEDGELQDMMANSPALSPESPYGNFRFCFRIKELLTAYQLQLCGGRRPVLRVLGTEAYTLEVVHWVLIHSPHCRDFDHLPTLDPQGPFGRAGVITWSPESLSDRFTWQLSGGALKKKRLAQSRGETVQTYERWLWNNAAFAFHLPGCSGLHLGRRDLLDHVEACKKRGDSSRVLRHPRDRYVSKREAQRLIEEQRARL